MAQRGARFQVCRDRDARGYPDGWFVEDSKSRNVLGRFKFRSEAQDMADKANNMAEGDAKERAWH